MKVRCFDGEKVIGAVNYTDNLDTWNGRNWTSGSLGRHLGVGKLEDGRFYACYGTEWQGRKDYAEVISEDEAKELVLRYNLNVYKELFDEEAPDLTG